MAKQQEPLLFRSLYVNPKIPTIMLHRDVWAHLCQHEMCWEQQEPVKKK